MKYVQALKPEKHNGGAFFEHEIHFELKGYGHYMVSHQLRKNIEEFVSEHIGSKHTDFRVSVQIKYIRPDTSRFSPSEPIATVKVRFADKNKALRFKLSWPQ